MTTENTSSGNWDYANIYEAVGQIALAWNFYELWQENLASGFVTGNHRMQAALFRGQPSRDVRNTVRRLVVATLPAESDLLRDVLNLMKEGDDLTEVRNKIVHGLWQGSPVPGVHQHTVIRRTPTKPSKLPPGITVSEMSLKEIAAVHDRISDFGTKLLEVSARLRQEGFIAGH